jgi:CheY-like chemotaxis protein
VEQSASIPSRVLIVEDEMLVRMCVADMIEEMGRKTVEAADADEAVRVLTNRTDIGFLFTDVEMPGSMDGYQLARTVRERWPDIAIMITSGRRQPRTGDIPPGGRFIAKPYDPRAIAQALSDLAA